MTVTSATPRKQYTATNGQTAFVYDFEIPAQADIRVYQNLTELALTTDYTVSGAGNSSGGTVTLTQGATAGDTITLFRDVTAERTVDYQTSGAFTANIVNSDFDKIWFLVQQLEESDSRAVHIAVTDTSKTMTLPQATARQNRIAGYDSDSRPAVAQTTITQLDSAISSVLSTLATTNGIAQANNYAELRSIFSSSNDPIDGTIMWVSQTGTAGAFHYDASDTTTADNGGTVIVDDQGRRWKRSAAESQMVNVRWFGAKGDTVTDDTAALQAAFDYAEANQKMLFLPAGVYPVSSTLEFGSNSTSVQSTAPLGMRGEGWNSQIAARSTFTGTEVLAARNTAGIHWEDFQINSNDYATTGIDTTWQAGTGPSVQNRYVKIRVKDSLGTSWKAGNNNDCIFDQCVCLGTDTANISFDLQATGGLVWMRDCIWTKSYLKISCQNGTLWNCWGQGIEFADQAVNTITIYNGYFYGNAANDSVMWSESFASFQSLNSLTVEGTQFIGSDPNTSTPVDNYFDLNAYSTVEFVSCEWVGTSPDMFGPNCRRDSFANVQVMFRGGEWNADINEPSEFDISFHGMIDSRTGKNYPNHIHNYYHRVSLAQAFTANTWYDVVDEGVLEAGTFLIRFTWNHNGANSPFVLEASAIVPIIGATSTDVGQQSSLFSSDVNAHIIGEVGNYTVDFRVTSDSTTGAQGIQVRTNVTLGSQGQADIYFVKLA